MWRCVLSSSDLTAFRQDHLVSGTVRRSDGVHVRVVGQAPPGADTEAIAPTLEDAYRYHIAAANKNGQKQ